MKKVKLYDVFMQHRITKEKVKLQVWAENVNDATNKCNFLFDYNGEYRWIGSGPFYDQNGNTRSKTQDN